MKILLCNLNNSDINFLVDLLIPFGLEVHTALKIDQVYQRLNKYFYSFLFVDIDNNTNNDWIKFIYTLNLNKFNLYDKNINLIVYTYKIEKKFEEKILSKGVIGILHKGRTRKEFSQKIKRIISLLELETERRSFVKIKPDHKDNATVTFHTLRALKKVKGRITDISLIGIAVELNTKEKLYWFFEKEFVKIYMSIKSRFIIANGIIARKGMTTAILFIDLKSENRSLLAQYIYEKIMNF